MYIHSANHTLVDTRTLEAWQPGTTIELVTLLISIPDAIIALCTFYIFMQRRQMRRAIQQRPDEHDPLINTHPIPNRVDSFDWFREQYDDLQNELAGETEQWGEEMNVLTRQN
ncbi:hypothetical protein NX059_009714 [Plenodomus lindquistii]|nr:hypothetical protein NX059_009714 [Plenodomus lindquistii]